MTKWIKINKNNKNKKEIKNNNNKKEKKKFYVYIPIIPNTIELNTNINSNGKTLKSDIKPIWQ